ncbi:hypothetical protein Tco_1143411 [Tanacetum coccineum]
MLTTVQSAVKIVIQQHEQAVQKEQEEKAVFTPYWKFPIFDDDDDEYTIQYREYLENSSNAITPDLPTEEPDNSLSMGDEHLSTIPETESDKLIKSSVENIVPIPSESEDFSDNESECDVPVCDDFKTFSNPLFDYDDDFSSSNDESFFNEDVPKENLTIYLNPLFDEEIISSKIDPHHFNAASDLIESLLNRDILTVSYPKIDYLLEEFSGELTHINLIPPGIKEAYFDPKEEIRLIKKLLYDNSSPRPPEEFNSENSDVVIESFSSSPIHVEGSDYLIEEIDIFLAPDDSIHPGIENDNYNSEGMTTPLLIVCSSLLPHFLFPLRIVTLSLRSPILSLSYSDNSLPEFETFSDHTEETSSGSTTTHSDNSLPEYDSFLFEIETDQGELTSVVMEDILGEPRVHVPNVLPTHPTLIMDSDFFPSDDSLESDLEVFFFFQN